MGGERVVLGKKNFFQRSRVPRSNTNYTVQTARYYGRTARGHRLALPRSNDPHPVRCNGIVVRTPTNVEPISRPRVVIISPSFFTSFPLSYTFFSVFVLFCFFFLVFVVFRSFFWLGYVERKKIKGKFAKKKNFF